MNYQEFLSSVEASNEPRDISDALSALWHDAHDDWQASHEIAQDDTSNEGSWVHAYLHRKEGDLGNAEYWYRMAGRKRFTGSLPAEWDLIGRPAFESLFKKFEPVGDDEERIDCGGS